MLDERPDVLGSLAERGHTDVHDVEAVHQVFAEVARRHGGHDVLVGGRDDPHVDLGPDRLGADGLNLAVLQEPQEHRLHPQAHFGDLVQEDGAAMGLLQHADLVAVSVREGAFDVAEQLRLEQRLRNAGAVDRHERLTGATGVAVNELCDEVLADAALAGNQDLGVAFRHALREGADRLDRGTAADDDRPGHDALRLGRGVRDAAWSHTIHPRCRIAHSDALTPGPATVTSPRSPLGAQGLVGTDVVYQKYTSRARCQGLARLPTETPYQMLSSSGPDVDQTLSLRMDARNSTPAPVTVRCGVAASGGRRRRTSVVLKPSRVFRRAERSGPAARLPRYRDASRR